jgi:hypothetical protein
MHSEMSKNVVPFIVFFLVANPETFKLTSSLLGSWIANSSGLPSNLGLLLHALVFVLLSCFVTSLVYGKKVSKYHRPDAHARMEPSEITGAC